MTSRWHVASHVIAFCCLTVLPAVAQAAEASSTSGVSVARFEEPAAHAPESTPTGCCCEDFASTDQPTWSARFGALFLQRSRPQATPFLINTNTGDPLINPNNFIFPFQAGADVGLVRYGDDADLDFRYFGVNQASDSQGPFNVGPGTGLPGSGGGSPDPLTLSSAYTFSLNSAEVNLKRTIAPRWTVLAGFRYVSFRDRLSATGVDTVNPDTTHLNLRGINNLYGMQVGVGTILWERGRMRIEQVLKAGLFGDAASSSFSLADSTGTFASVNAGRTRPAFVGDLNFTGTYELNDVWSLRAGYQLLWLSGVATASEQIKNVDFNTGVFTTNMTHGVFFHGATIGLERSW